jgi:hypothetical protein
MVLQTNPETRLFDGNCVSKVLFLVTFYSKHTMAMTFENLCAASSCSFMS